MNGGQGVQLSLLSEPPSARPGPDEAADVLDAAGHVAPRDDDLADHEARQRIRTELGGTLFVSAGAGSGKTAALVDRIVALVAHGTPVEHIAGITFTEKAADELRHRVRAELRRQAAAATDPTVGGRFDAALDELDQAALCTLHAFAQRILTAFPVEAGLPPAVAVLDEIASDADFDQRWRAFYDELVSRPDLDRTMALALELGITADHLRSLAERFDDNWDRVRVPPRPFVEPPPLEITPLLEAADELLGACEVADPNDTLVELLLDWLPGWRDALARTDDELARLDLLVDVESVRIGNKGRKAAWAATSFGDSAPARAAARGLASRDADGPLAVALGMLADGVLQRVGAELAAFCLDEARRRQRTGQLTFHDLLVVCRHLLHHPSHGPRVRRELAERFTAILIDEYQDTDPLQLDIVLAIATPPGEDAPRPGQLFFVGDPKQSLYRFRRADIDLFLRTPEMASADRVSLTSNFRSTADILTWVNDVFGRLITEARADDGTTLAQPAYEPLDPRPTPALVGPAVGLLGVEAHPRGTPVGTIREHEANDIAGALHAAHAEGWTVRRDGAGATAPARWRDMAILIPARTMLGQLEIALRDAAIPYRLDTGSLVYATDEVRSLLHTLRLVQDPSDHLAVVSALRSPLFGCSDVELYRWRRERGGSWTPTARLPPRLDGVDTVWDAMADLRRRIADRAWRTPSEQLESLVRDRRVLETALATPGRFDAWHRVRFVIEQARAWSDAGGRFLRDYLDWTARQTSLTGRIAEVPLDAADDADGTTFVDGPAPARLATESHTGAGVGADPAADVDDPDDAVRILTVHGAKGLEFPIAVVCGLSSRPAGRQRGVQVSWDAERGQIVRLRADLAQAGFDAHHAIDEQMDAHERSRLLYVACTRARDHLVVSIHRADTTGPTGAHALAEQITSSEHAAAVDGIEEALAAPVPAATGREPTPIAPARHLVDLDRWRTDREALLGAAQRSRSVSATALAARALDDAGPNPPSPDAETDDDRFEELTGAAAPDDLEPGLAKRPVDLDLPAWRKGRYGTALGRAVHAVLQVVDLATGDGVDAAARAQAAAEGIEGEHELIAGLARSALAAPSVLAASKTDHWREVYVGIPVGDQVLEGYVDLLYRGPDGLVVVDHKTDRVDGDEDVAAKLAAYRLQLAAYALAVERATGETVSDARLVFCRPAQAREEPVIDLRAAMAEVEAALDAGAP